MYSQLTSVGSVPENRSSESTAPTTVRAPAISLFGPLSVRLNGRSVKLGPPRQRAVLAVLLTDVGHVVPVPTMVDRLWGSEPPQQALASLHSYVSRLRKLLSHRPLPNGSRLEIQYRPPGYVLLAPTDEIDALRFEQLAQEAHQAAHTGDHAGAFRLFGAALRIWTAPPLDDLAEYPFAGQESVRLERIRLTVIEQRAEMAFLLRRDDVTLPELETEVSRNPLEERLVTLLMRAQYRMGRQADALRTFERTRHLLADELGVDPSLQLQRMHANILRHDPCLHLPEELPASEPKPLALAGTHRPAEPTTDPEAHPFVGRHDELATLIAAQRATWSGTGRTAVLLGEAGSGKTRLLQQFTATAGASDVITVQCPNMQGMPPYWPWARILRRALDVRPRFVRSLSGRTRRVLGHLVPELAPAHDEPSQQAPTTPTDFEFHDAITRALEILSRSPLILVVENLHWADLCSWEVLRFLVGQLTGARLTLLVSLRTFLPAHDPHLRKTLAALVQQPGVEIIHLGGLSQSETAALAATVTSRTAVPGSDVIAALHERTHGNPYFVLELARHLTDRTTLDDVRTMVPDSLRDVILERIGSLPEDVRTVLDMASVLAQGVPRVFLEDMTGQAGVVAEAVRAAQRGGLLRLESEEYESIDFEHSLVRDVVRQDLSEEAAVELRQRAVRSVIRQLPVLTPLAVPVTPADAALPGAKDARGR
ncbi:hypothetical protein GCM10018793_61690 [Streptomyces sulfonofaciens]|uniref:OmpR/PhoB-type domain-containing protein n=1 Tax=Streptomyces sulfonofaciens TaxID=68272 RepID=A0A919GLY8_9ACTN|nr:BTAD domain-containing putative transcriptional regulator [Streptomyces sulfonofaciens]GHH87124.1 hypothetical protein GCM10018793_61690 [Streptomyces sulfonofaciens]